MTKRSHRPAPFSAFSLRLPDGVKVRADVGAARMGLSLTAMIQDILIDTFPAISALDGPLGRLAVDYDPDSEAGHRLAVLADMRRAIDDLLPLMDAEEKKARKDLAEGIRKASARIDAANAPVSEPDQE